MKVILMLLALAGCGGGGSSTPESTTVPVNCPASAPQCTL